MTKTMVNAMLILLTAASWGCAGFKVSDGRQGIRVYDPAMYIVVADQRGTFKTQVFVGPNLCSHYEIKPESFLAKNEFSLELDAGVPSKVTDTLDTTAILTFLQGAAEQAGKAAGVAVASTDPLEGAVLDKGLYMWTGAGLVRFPQDGEMACP